MRHVTFELQLTEADQGTLEFLSLTAGKIARLLFPDDVLDADRAEALLKLITEQAMSPKNGRLSSSQKVKERLHAELGRAALELFGEEERRQLFRAVYPAVAGDNYAHKLLSDMCSKQLE
ncbi:hypothetical protein D3C80_1628950 [compost metagenome]